MEKNTKQNKTNTYPAVVKQYLQIKDKYKNMILLYRIGDFYEFFFDDAIKVAKSLNITLTHCKYKTAKRIPMSGFPSHAIEKYLPKLIKMRSYLAFCEQINKTKNKNKLISRKVVTILTPGTITDDHLLSPRNENLIGAIYEKNNEYGYVTLDISTGNFIGYIIKDINSLKGKLSLTNPVELLYPKNFINIDKILTKAILKQERPTYEFSYNFSKELLKNQFQNYDIDCFGVKKSHLAIKSAGCILNYVKLHFNFKKLKHIKNLKIIYPEDTIMIDAVTAKNLQLIISDGDNNSLFKLLDTTCTYMGSRKLKRWILNPIRDIDKLKSRQNIIKFLLKNKLFLKLKEYLKLIEDIERIQGRLGMSTLIPSDLVKIRNTLKVTPKIKELLKNSGIAHLEKLHEEIPDLDDLYKKLLKAIAIEPSFKIQDGGVIASGYSHKLDELRNFSLPQYDLIKNWEMREKEKLGIRSLKILHNNSHGYFIQIKKSLSLNIKLPDSYTKIQSLTNNERYITLELKEFENKQKTAQFNAISYENVIYYKLLSFVNTKLDLLIMLGKSISEIDVLSTLAERAYTLNYVCPKFSNKKIFKYVGGRHPLVENINNKQFVSNDLLLNNKHNTLLITGPNMGGKSTYMKQSALIVIMCNMGSLVPAESVVIGPIDRIFTRMGFNDDLSSGKSSFMVEMTETSTILNNCTKFSLVLFDEIGRGTNTKEGIAIAWGCILHLVKTNSYNLISTHFNELNKISDFNSKVKNVHFSIINNNNNIKFLHKIQEGPATQTCGISIAKLAGLPESVINTDIKKII